MESGYYVYVVSWPGHHSLKVGYSGHRRARVARYVSKRGGQLHLNVHFDTCTKALDHEELVSRALRRQWPLDRFSSAAEAAPMLGGRGSGWTECMWVPDSDTHYAVALAERMMFGE